MLGLAHVCSGKYLFHVNNIHRAPGVNQSPDGFPIFVIIEGEVGQRDLARVNICSDGCNLLLGQRLLGVPLTLRELSLLHAAASELAEGLRHVRIFIPSVIPGDGQIVKGAAGPCGWWRWSCVLLLRCEDAFTNLG